MNSPRPLDGILAPKSIAIVGASRDRNSIGWSLLHNLLLGEYEGPIYPVNPRASTIHSLRCWPRLADLPEVPELVVVLVPRDLVIPIVDEAIGLGTRAFVVITAGFGETGGQGAVLEATLRERLRAAGARAVGPNCMGVINADAAVRMNATFAPTPAQPGGLGFVSQSGALGVAILNVAADLGIGFTQFVSMGNKVDVSGNDLLEHFEHDPATRVIAMYLESFGNPRRFTTIAKRVARRKPIVVVKSGRTAAGARAASSHTGALAGPDVTVSAFLEQCGVVRAGSIEEMFDVVRAFDRCPLPSGDRVAIVTNAGGPAIMATDALVALGLEIAELSESTRAGLASFLPAAASLANPVDMIASATPEQYQRALELVLADPGVDMAMVINVTPLLSDPIDVLEAASLGAASHPAKPVLAVMMADEVFWEKAAGRRELLPVYRFPEGAANALTRLARYGAWRRREPEAEGDFAMDHTAIASLLGSADADGWLGTDEAFRLLETAGIPAARRVIVPDLPAALAAAEALGWPVVVKAIAPGLVHKTELEAVAVDLRTAAELEQAIERMSTRLRGAGLEPSGFLVQELVRGGVETILGLATDERFGPILMFGLGGVLVEALGDVRFAVPPLTRTEAVDVVDGVRGRALLDGVRGKAPVDKTQLADALCRLAQLVEHHPEIAEIDVNPFLARAGGGVALDARVRVRG
jgi:acetyl coenzyme A synthetase (ADP forming)-like protein